MKSYNETVNCMNLFLKEMCVQAAWYLTKNAITNSCSLCRSGNCNGTRRVCLNG